MTIGRLRNDKGEDSELSLAIKMNAHFLKLFRVYFNSLKWQI